MSGNVFVSIDREITSPDEDILGWTPQAQRLAAFLGLPGRPTPLTLGVQGDWGSGKTSFLNLVLAHLGQGQSPVEPTKEAPLADRLLRYRFAPGDHVKALSHFPPSTIYLVRFDSWVFTQSEWPADYLFPIYVTQVIRDYLVATKQIKADGPETGLLRWMARVLPKVGAGVAAAGGAAAGFVLPGIGIPMALLCQVAGSGIEDLAEKMGAAPPPDRLTAELVGFKPGFQTMVDGLLKPSPEQKTFLPQLRDAHYNRLLILVDDLDRVPPLTAVNITEKIKLFMDVPGCVFILAADLQVIRQGLKIKLGETITEEEGKNYLDKIVKIQYQVPQVPRDRVGEIARLHDRFANALTALQDKEGDQVDELLLLFPAIAGNPRNLKRVLNNLAFTLDLVYGPDKKPPDGSTTLRLLALTLLHQYDAEAARNFYHWLARQPSGQQALDTSLVDGLAGSLQHAEEEDEGLRDFATLAGKLGYTIHDWRGAFSLSTLTAVREG